MPQRARGAKRQVRALCRALRLFWARRREGRTGQLVSAGEVSCRLVRDMRIEIFRGTWTRPIAGVVFGATIGCGSSRVGGVPGAGGSDPSTGGATSGGTSSAGTGPAFGGSGGAAGGSAGAGGSSVNLIDACQDSCATQAACFDFNVATCDAGCPQLDAIYTGACRTAAVAELECEASLTCAELEAFAEDYRGHPVCGQTYAAYARECAYADTPPNECVDYCTQAEACEPDRVIGGCADNCNVVLGSFGLMYGSACSVALLDLYECYTMLRQDLRGPRKFLNRSGRMGSGPVRGVSGRSPDRGHRRGRRRLLLPSERRKACQVDLSQSAIARKSRPWVAGGARVRER
jgi:hypothetical protein